MSVTLEGEDEQTVGLFVEPGTPEHAALSEWAMSHGMDPARLGSEASVLRALLPAGADQLREQTLDAGYGPRGQHDLGGAIRNPSSPAPVCGAHRAAVGTMNSPPLRGQVYRVDLGHGFKPWVVVSNNARNRNLDMVIAARITTTGKNAHLPTIVTLAATDPPTGHVLCDDLVPLYRDELTAPLGALSPATLRALSTALRLALP